MTKPKIGIRPIIDGRRNPIPEVKGVRESLEDQTMGMAKAAKKLIEENLFYPDGTPVQCVISPTTIGCGNEAAICADFFSRENVCATLSVTPCWCYGSETMDLDPMTVKAVWGFNGTERPGAVYLAAVMAAHAQRGLPAFAIYGYDVQDMDDQTIPCDVSEKLLRFARCGIAVGLMRNKAYCGLGAVSMGISGSYLDADFMQNYLGVRPEWVDMIEIQRRIDKGIYDPDEYKIVLSWINENCANRKGFDPNVKELLTTPEQDKIEWEYIAKMSIIIRDIMLGNPRLAEHGFIEESNGRNAIFGGFQGQRQWTDYLPNADFTEAIMNSTFDWNGKRQPFILATENDSLNAVAMLFLNLVSNRPAIFSDVRTYWSPDAVKRVTGYELTGKASDGLMHLLNSGASALDGNGGSLDENGNHVMKEWWNVTEQDIENMLANTKWAPANKCYFRGGGFSSQYISRGEMPVTMVRVNLVDGLGPVIQIAEGYTVELPDEVSLKILARTDPTWPSLWFAPNLTGKGAFTGVYNVMANWGANHGASCYGHVGADIITLASMLRIPVSMHNVPEEKIYRPHAWNSFGTFDKESADYRACEVYGPLYK
ncbi:MAG: L-fucose isomerase [Clostridiales bacterium]|nr:L-fucose isomerase [Clostridiales bacterium]